MSKSSDNFNQKERGKATIALILGTSSAGKSTLITHLTHFSIFSTSEVLS